VRLNSKYDDKEWSIDAQMDIYDSWDPNKERTRDNFNPFERNEDGNKCDTNGFYPGETRYKDPIRPAVSFTTMQKEKDIVKKVQDNPKPGQKKGAPGCYQGFNVMK
jgi:hypothetical protein